MSPHEPESNAAAAALYRKFTGLSAGSAPIDFEALCAQHPVLAQDLRRLHAAELARSRTAVVPRLDKPAERDETNKTPTPKTDRFTPPDASRYRLDGEIARGGMGAILKVWDTGLHRTLAMKVILGEEERIADGSTADARLSRFLEEAQITGQLDHPGVVPVHELGVDQGGRVYFTMRLVKGRHLGEIIAKARTGADGWNLTRALNVLHRVCETMAYAHSKGVVHRDLKPENVMVGQFGETYAMDWGLARVLGQPDGEEQRRRMLASSAASFVQTDRRDEAATADPGSRTQDGAIVGTPYYMPPEQASGELETIGPQSDVYALGAILYHLLTGKRPYAEVAATSVLSIIRAVIEGPPIAVHRLDAKAPAELVAICERAMARAPKARYASMVDMAADLQAYLEGRVVNAYQSGAVAEFVKWVRRNRGFSAALAALVVVAVTALVAFAWTQAERARAIAAEEEHTRKARDEALANLDQAHQQGYFANVTAASASLAAGETVEAKRHLGNCLPALRGWEWHHLSLAADASVAVFDAHAGSIGDLALDGPGRRLVSSATDGTLRLWDLDAQGNPRLLTTGPGSDRLLSAPAVAFVDGGRQVIAIGRQQDARVFVWDAASAELQSQLPLTTRALYAVAVAPGGDRAALGAPDHSIHIVDPQRGDDLARLVGHQDTVRALVFSHDGTLLASGSEDRTVRIWNIAEKRAVGEPIATATAVYSVAFAPASQQLAVGLEDGSVWRFAGAANEPLDRLSGHRSAVYGLCFDRDGTRLASASFDKTVRVWNAAEARSMAVLIGHEQPVHCVQFATGSSTLASGSADGSVRLWDVERNRATVTCRGAEELLTAVDISRDGSRIVIGSSWPGTIEVIDAETGTHTLRVNGPEDSVVALAFAPDGQRFAVAFQEESSVRICDLATGKLSEPMLGHEESVTSIAWSPDGATIVSSAADRIVRAWDVASRTPRGAPLLHEQGVTSIAYSADGGLVAAGTVDGAIHVWEAATQKQVRVVAGGGQRVLALAFAPQGNTLAGGFIDGTVRVFEPEATTARLVLAGHEQRVSSLRFLADGTRLVSGSYDGTLRIWDLASGRLALALRGHTGAVTGVAVGGMGGPETRIVSTSHDGTLLIRHARREPQKRELR